MHSTLTLPRNGNEEAVHCNEKGKEASVEINNQLCDEVKCEKNVVQVFLNSVFCFPSNTGQNVPNKNHIFVCVLDFSVYES